MTSCNESKQSMASLFGALEDLQFQMACALNALDAIQVAMSCGEYKAEGYLDGLFEIHRHLNTLNQEVKTKLAEARVIRKTDTVI